MNALEAAREKGYAIRTCPSITRHENHTYERRALEPDGSWTAYTAWCPGNHYY